ncbi:MAG: hypothetical protein JWQ07_624 [Ramlibacter sp.]|nr:hypothetical protein [Ramlibacter sp.]
MNSKAALTLPSRSLLGPKPLRYVSAMETDIRKTFRRVRLFAHLQASVHGLPRVQTVTVS